MTFLHQAAFSTRQRNGGRTPRSAVDAHVDAIRQHKTFPSGH